MPPLTELLTKGQYQFRVVYSCTGLRKEEKKLLRKKFYLPIKGELLKYFF